jgi:hypothetical protein
MTRNTFVAISLIALAGLGYAMHQLGTLAKADPSAKNQSPDPPPRDFVPSHSTVLAVPIKFKQMKDDLSWLSGREATVRVITTIAPVGILPVYVVKEASLKPAAFDDTGKLLTPPSVRIEVVDLMASKAGFDAVVAELTATDPKFARVVVLPPERGEVRADLQVEFNGKKPTLGSTRFSRSSGGISHRLDFPIQSPQLFRNVALAERRLNEFRVQFAEDYAGYFQKNDLEVTTTFVSQAITLFKNQVTRGNPPDQPVVFVRFGGAVNQSLQIRQLLVAMSETNIRMAKDAVLPDTLVNVVLNKALDAANLKLADDRKLTSADNDKLLTFVLGNGMSLQATLGKFKTIKEEDRKQMERNMSRMESWDKSREDLTKIGVKVEASAFELFSGGMEINTERHRKTNNIGSDEREDFSKDVIELFRTVEGELPVVALDVKQLTNAENAKVDVSKVVFGSFVLGRRSLTHDVSLQGVSRDSKLSAFKTDLDKRVERLEAMIAQLSEKSIVGKPQRMDAYKLHTADSDGVITVTTSGSNLKFNEVQITYTPPGGAEVLVRAHSVTPFYGSCTAVLPRGSTWKVATTTNEGVPITSPNNVAVNFTPVRLPLPAMVSAESRK